MGRRPWCQDQLIPLTRWSLRFLFSSASILTGALCSSLSLVLLPSLFFPWAGTWRPCWCRSTTRLEKLPLRNFCSWPRRWRRWLFILSWTGLWRLFLFSFGLWGLTPHSILLFFVTWTFPSPTWTTSLLSGALILLWFLSEDGAMFFSFSATSAFFWGLTWLLGRVFLLFLSSLTGLSWVLLCCPQKTRCHRSLRRLITRAEAIDSLHQEVAKPVTEALNHTRVLMSDPSECSQPPPRATSRAIAGELPLQKLDSFLQSALTHAKAKSCGTKPSRYVHL